MCVYICGGMHMQGTNVEVRGHLWDLGLSFYYVGPKDQTPFVKLGVKHL